MASQHGRVVVVVVKLLFPLSFSIRVRRRSQLEYPMIFHLPYFFFLRFFNLKLGFYHARSLYISFREISSAPKKLLSKLLRYPHGVTLTLWVFPLYSLEFKRQMSWTKKSTTWPTFVFHDGLESKYRPLAWGAPSCCLRAGWLYNAQISHSPAGLRRKKSLLPDLLNLLIIQDPFEQVK